MRSSFIVHRNRTAPGHFLWLGAVFEPRVAYIRSRVGFNLLARGPSWGAPLPSMGKGWRPRGDGQARRPRGADAAASRETIQLLGDPDLSAAAPPPAPAAAVPALAQLVPMASAPAAPLEDWQEIQSDGSKKCVHDAKSHSDDNGAAYPVARGISSSAAAAGMARRRAGRAAGPSPGGAGSAGGRATAIGPAKGRYGQRPIRPVGGSGGTIGGPAPGNPGRPAPSAVTASGSQ